MKSLLTPQRSLQQSDLAHLKTRCLCQAFALNSVWFLKKAKLDLSQTGSQDRQQRLSLKWLYRANSRKEETNKIHPKNVLVTQTPLKITAM